MESRRLVWSGGDLSVTTPDYTLDVELHMRAAPRVWGLQASVKAAEAFARMPGQGRGSTLAGLQSSRGVDRRISAGAVGSCHFRAAIARACSSIAAINSSADATMASKILRPFSAVADSGQPQWPKAVRSVMSK
jgi:hypothetical protein